MGNSSSQISKPIQTRFKLSFQQVKVSSLLKRLSASKAQYLTLRMVEQMHLNNLNNKVTLDQSCKKKDKAESRIRKIDEILSYFTEKENQVDKFTKQLNSERNPLHQITATQTELQQRLEQMKNELKSLQNEGATLNSNSNDPTQEGTMPQTPSNSNSRIKGSIEESQMCNSAQWNPNQFLKRLLQEAQKNDEAIQNEEQVYTKNDLNQIKNLNKFEHIQLSPQMYKLSLQNHRLPVTQFTEFCSKNWSSVQFLKLVSCQIDDQKWRILVQHAENFPNLKLVYIYDNQIERVEKMHLQKFKSLEKISFCFCRIHTNRLNQSSLKEIDNYVKEYPHVKVEFEEQQISDLSY